MGILDKFKKQPEWEKAINGFLKDSEKNQPDIDFRFADNVCYISFIRGANDRLYSVAIHDNEQDNSAKIYVYTYKFDDIDRLKEIALEIVENQKRIESGLEPDGFVSAEQIITEIGKTTVSTKELKPFLAKVIDGSALLVNDIHKTKDTVMNFSDNLHLTAQEMMMLELGDIARIKDYNGYSFVVENHKNTRKNKLDIEIYKGSLPIGGIFTSKEDVVKTLNQIDDGSLEINRSTHFIALKNPSNISEINSFDKSQRIAWKIQDGLFLNETQVFESKLYTMRISADYDGYAISVSFTDNENIPEDFRGFELYYKMSSEFDFNCLLKEIRQVEEETLKIPVTKILGRMDEMKKVNGETPVNTKEIMDAFEAVGVKPMENANLHEINVVMGSLYNIKSFVMEYKQLEKDRNQEQTKNRIKS